MQRKAALLGRLLEAAPRLCRGLGAALVAAAGKGDAASVHQLLEAGADVHHDEGAPLLAAARGDAGSEVCRLAARVAARVTNAAQQDAEHVSAAWACQAAKSQHTDF